MQRHRRRRERTSFGGHRSTSIVVRLSFYSDGYGELLVYAAELELEIAAVLTFSDGRDDFAVFADLEASSPPTLPERGGIAWDNYSSSVFCRCLW